MRIRWAQESLELLPQRAAWWPRASALIVADLHLGKAATYRSLGVPVPNGGEEADLARLSGLLHDTAAEHLVVLGDLLHARSGRSAETLAALGNWRKRHTKLQVVIVRGNHDLKAGDPPSELGFVCHSPPVTADILTGVNAQIGFGHDPAEQESSPIGPIDPPNSQATPPRPTLFGHVHPCIAMEPAAGRGPGLRAPCFWFSKSFGVLPAFGSFTGGHAVRPQRGDRVFAVGPAEVVEVTMVGSCAR